MLISLIFNVLLAAAKGVVGVIAGSHALLADAVHSLSDVIAYIFNYHGCRQCRMFVENGKKKVSKQIRMKILAKEAHATYLTSVTYYVFGIVVYIYNLIVLIMGDTTPPEFIALVMAFITLGIYVLVYGYYKSNPGDEMKYCKVTTRNNYLLNKINLFVGAAVVIGVIGARTGFPIMDAVAGIVVGSVMLSLGAHFFREQSSLLKGKEKNFILFFGEMRGNLGFPPLIKGGRGDLRMERRNINAFKIVA